ncbi:MAG: ATP-binding protein [Sedimenticolaceae bacterium]
MRFVTKLYLLFGGVVGLAVIATALALWGARQAHISFVHADLAHRSYEGHLSLSNHTYQLFKQLGDAITIGDLDEGKLEEDLLALIRRDIASIRAIIAEEIELVGQEELEELENLARIEHQLEHLLKEYQSVVGVSQRGPTLAEWRRLAAILDEQVDRDFNGLIQAALDEEARELEEIQSGIEDRLAFNRYLTLVFAVLSGLLAIVSLWIVVRDLKEPVARLIGGAEALARGELTHRIETHGVSELDGVARAFNAMADEIGSRERALEVSNRDLEQAVGERTAELEKLLATLRSAEADRRRMLADVSHELRTPLTIIRGEAEIALRGGEKPPEVYREALAKTRDAARHTAALVDDLLFIARREAGEVRLAVREFDLAALLKQVVDDSRSLAVAHRPAIRFDSLLEQAMLHADSGRLRQVFLILLENAIHYGGDRIDVRLAQSPHGYAVSVSDNGPGVSSDERGRIFERFFRGNDAARRYQSGAGLGLPVAKAIVEAHDGWIGLESEPHEGTTFTVMLPRQPRLEAVS